MCVDTNVVNKRIL